MEWREEDVDERFGSRDRGFEEDLGSLDLEVGLGVVSGFEVLSRFMEGRTSFFCLEAGRISSRSTGTPRETRKRRRMRDLIQFGGWRGGGATSWDQRERERSVVKMEELVTGSGDGNEEASDALGKRVSSCSVVDVMRSARESRVPKLRGGGCECISLQYGI